MNELCEDLHDAKELIAELRKQKSDLELKSQQTIAQQNKVITYLQNQNDTLARKKKFRLFSAKEKSVSSVSDSCLPSSSSTPMSPTPILQWDSEEGYKV